MMRVVDVSPWSGMGFSNLPQLDLDMKRLKKDNEELKKRNQNLED